MKRLNNNERLKTNSSSKRRRLNPEVRRVELLEAALHVLRDLGPTRARVEDVTRAAGAAKGTFYLYFSSWNDFLAGVRDHIVTTYTAELHRRFDAAAPSDWWSAFENECLRLVDFIVELGDLHKAIFHGPSVDRTIDASMSSETVLSTMLTAGIQPGACRPVDADTAAPLLFSILHTTADRIVQTGDRERCINSMLDLLHTWLLISSPVVKNGSSRPPKRRRSKTIQ